MYRSRSRSSSVQKPGSQHPQHSMNHAAHPPSRPAQHSSCCHSDLVQVAASRYEAHLQRVEAMALAPATLAAVRGLRAAVRCARTNGGALAGSDVDFTVDSIAVMPREDRKLLINQFALGLGHDDARVVVLGNEAAYEVDRDDELLNFCLESCASQVIWSCGGSPEVVDRLSGGAVRLPVGRPFHIFPNDFFREGGGHTWVRLAQILGTGEEVRPGASPGLGDLCYQIELSAHPSQVASRGRAPTAERVQFLVDVMRTLSTTADVLLIHGPGRVEFQHARQQLAAAFLGLPNGATLNWADLGEPRRPIAALMENGRRVVRTRALGNTGVTAEFIRWLKWLTEPLAA